MIRIPPNVSVSVKFLQMVGVFNRLEESLKYPNTENSQDAKRYIENAEQELKKKGLMK